MIIVQNKNFLDIPRSEFYFDNSKNLVNALVKLNDYEYEINIFLDIDILSENELEDILLTNKKYKTLILNKEDKLNYYKKNIEVIIWVIK